ncbi:biliverdin-producing heme oxygenase [Micromonospora sp. WMMC241]|uniref:biliverdin-producing heme oxygenase n=1 Tax=Micromonospora sp. WMMC241 TaxID=3015159 RepID=UPI0022B71FF3|nr:biliverdin-producing heme oxygenase [Micromonospora sp. WMMC241]MCZ7436075.1 biliverdin-producing heme oxygenase [Micromonospora sp. WMMC241]
MPDQPRPPAASPMLAALRDGTRDHHAAVERRLGLPDRIRTRDDLAAALATLLAAWGPLERELAAADWSGLPLDPRVGEAAALLRTDLAALGVAVDRPAAGSSGLDLDTTARAVGGRYVLLGSALGGRVVAPEVERRLGLRAGEATRFFRRVGGAPGRDWRAFRFAVAGREWSAVEVTAAVDAARSTFDLVGRVEVVRPSG